MQLVELLGYAGAAVTFATYSMKTMIPLRACGITANVLFITYGYFDSIYPALILHSVLLPLNATRLYQMVQLVKRVSVASRGDLDMDWLKPFMSSRAVKTGDVLFHKGEAAREMFYVVAGRFRLAESGIEILPGAVVGELGLITPDQARTQTLECVEAGSLLQIGYQQVRQLYFQNPKFGFYFLQLTSRRLFENIGKLEAELASRQASEDAV
jgi:CRP/FNR family transcriptional regulator, cyclic AMP receptor protein